MASIAATGRAQPQFGSARAAEAFGMLAVVMLAASRVAETYAANWVIGVPALLFVLLFGRGAERGLLLGLGAITLLAVAEQRTYGTRQLVFVAIFLLFARYVSVNPKWTAVIFTVALVVKFALSNEWNALYIVVPTLMLLMVIADMRSRQDAGERQPAGKLGFVSALAFVFPWIGSGSRAAFLIWVMFTVRRVTWSMAFAGLIGIAVVLALPDLKMADKLLDSFNELTSPVNEGGGVQLRGLEGLIFLGWLQTASLRELLLGSLEFIWLPGQVLARFDDYPYIPHNQVFGLVFQFGFVGLALVLLYFRWLWRDFANYRAGRFLLFLTLVPSFFLLHGFINVDVALLAAAANHYRWRQP